MFSLSFNELPKSPKLVNQKKWLAWGFVIWEMSSKWRHYSFYYLLKEEKKKHEMYR
jgi:hypothetical protein